jgi:hypothetical protein
LKERHPCNNISQGDIFSGKIFLHRLKNRLPFGINDQTCIKQYFLVDLLLFLILKFEKAHHPLSDPFKIIAPGETEMPLRGWHRPR